MWEGSAVTKDILALKIRFHVPRYSCWGMLLVYLDIVRSGFVGHHPIIVSGQDISKGSIEKKHNELVDFISRGLTTFRVNTDLQGKLKYNLENRMPADVVKEIVALIQANNMGAAENAVKKSIEAALSTDRIECQLKYEMLTRGEIAEAQIEDEIAKMTFAQRIDVVLPYADNNRPAADRIVRENEKDLALVKFTFNRGGLLFGSGMIISVISSRRIHGVYVSAGPNSGFSECGLTVPVVDFFTALMNGVDNPGADRTNAAKIESAIRKMAGAALYTLVSSKSVEPITKLLSEAIAGGPGDAPRVDASVDYINSLRLELLLAPIKNRNAAEPESDEKSEIYKGLKIVKGAFILSPTKGNNVSSLKAGDHVQVVLDASDPMSMKILKSLNLISGKKVAPMGAPVHSIKFQPKEGYKVFVKIAEGVLGKVEEEQDVKVKMGDPVVDVMLEKTHTGLVVSIVAAAVILVAIVLLYIFL